jgi:hypothetical protein
VEEEEEEEEEEEGGEEGALDWVRLVPSPLAI